jgi:hypothetical protein
MTQKFAFGKRAFGFCDRCNFRYPLAKLDWQVVNQKPTGIKVCSACNDEDHPQLQLGRFPINDPVALLNPRPDVDPGRGLFGWNPVGNAAIYATGLIGIVNVNIPPPTSIVVWYNNSSQPVYWTNQSGVQVSWVNNELIGV